MLVPARILRLGFGMEFPESPPPAEPAPQPRREFLKTAACIALGGCALAVPIGAAVVVLAHPLKSKGVPLPVKITMLSALPPNVTLNLCTAPGYVLDAYAGIEGVRFKHEGENPTGSFKDRGMTVATTHAVASPASFVPRMSMNSPSRDERRSR